METLQGAGQAIATLEAIPNAERYAFADMLGRLGRDILALQRSRVARATGALAAGLTINLLIDETRVRLRVGLLGVAATSKSARRAAAKRGGGDPRNLGDIYYGRFVEFGRSAQTVIVERRRRVNGMLRTLRRRKRPEDIVRTYPMKVPGMAPRPFVNVPDGEVDRLVEARSQAFWNDVLKRVEG